MTSFTKSQFLLFAYYFNKQGIHISKADIKTIDGLQRQKRDAIIYATVITKILMNFARTGMTQCSIYKGKTYPLKFREENFFDEVEIMKKLFRLS